MDCLSLKRFLDYDIMSHSPSKKSKLEGVSTDFYRATLDHQQRKNDNFPDQPPFAKLESQYVTFDKMEVNVINKAEGISDYKRKSPYKIPPQISVACAELAKNYYNSNDNGNNIDQSTGQRINTDDKTLFTYSQLMMICERMLKEQKEKIREEYDKVLSDKIAENYDTFLKFTYDQLYKSLEPRGYPASYFS